MAAYAQRTDLNSSAMTPEYGGIKALADAQRAVPMGTSPTNAIPQVQRPIPGEMGSLTRPTENPNEPITAGANFGPGPNALAAGIPIPRTQQSNAISEIRAIAQMYSSDDLLDLVDLYGNES
jgi:hypothetical protein